MRDFDEHITARYMGFTGAADYYDKASSSHVLDRIAIPTLVIHSDDDPFIVISAGEPAQAEGESEHNISAHLATADTAHSSRDLIRMAATMGVGRNARSWNFWRKWKPREPLRWMRITASNSVPRRPRWKFHGRIRRGDCITWNCAARPIQKRRRIANACEVDGIPEARQFPALRRFLIDVNSPPSPWQTAKCDVWADEAEPARTSMVRLSSRAAMWTWCWPDEAAALRPSLEAHQRLARELAQMLEANAGAGGNGRNRGAPLLLSPQRRGGRVRCRILPYVSS